MSVKGKATHRSRTTIAQRIAKGSHNPSRDRPPGPATPEGAPPMPEIVRQDPEYVQAWQEFAGYLQTMRVLSQVDGSALEHMAVLWTNWRRAVREVDRYGLVIEVERRDGSRDLKANPAAKLALELSVKTSQMLGRFGLTPADRDRVQAIVGSETGDTFALLEKLDDDDDTDDISDAEYEEKPKSDPDSGLELF